MLSLYTDRFGWMYILLRAQLKQKPWLDLWWGAHPGISPKCARNTEVGVRSSFVVTRGAVWQFFLHSISRELKLYQILKVLEISSRWITMLTRPFDLTTNLPRCRNALNAYRKIDFRRILLVIVNDRLETLYQFV